MRWQPSRAAHTPWHIANGVQIRSARHQIAKVWMMRDGEGNANARLIAASPKLLSALQDLLDVVTGQKEGDAIAVMNAQSAINEATGRTE